MKLRPCSDGLSVRANRCLSTAGIPAEKEAVLHALKTEQKRGRQHALEQLHNLKDKLRQGLL